MGEFVRVTDSANMKPGSGIVAEVNGKTLAIFNVDGAFHVIDNTCVHRGGPLGEGTMFGARLPPPLIGMGLCAVVGHIALVRGYAATDASLAQTFEFSRLPFTVALGYAAFGETIDAWTWIGALIIFASAIYITRREAQLRRQAAQGGTPD